MKDRIYDWAMTRYMTRLNRAFLETCRDGAAIMDIGIGTGAARVNNKEIIVRKKLRIAGYDIDPVYIRACEKKIAKYGLEKQLTVKRADVNRETADAAYDHVLFSDSFAMIPDCCDLIADVRRFLKNDGTVVVLTTLDEDGFGLPYRKFVKPKIKSLTSVEFGRVTTIAEFKEEPKNRNLVIRKMDFVQSIYCPGCGLTKSFRIDLQ
jgi:ubiquinone/menaquinone biosynthesis C-methylase UbiE